MEWDILRNGNCPECNCSISLRQSDMDSDVICPECNTVLGIIKD